MKTKDLAEVGIYVALALVLDFIKEEIGILDMPSGGSINIALIPIVLASFHLGLKNGLITAAMWLLVSSLLGLNPNFLNIPQWILDYLVSSLVMGCAAIFGKKLYQMELGIMTVMFIRTLSIIVSGAYFWAGEAGSGSAAAWLGSLSYNLPYSLATALLLMIVTPLIYARLSKN